MVSMLEQVSFAFGCSCRDQGRSKGYVFGGPPLTFANKVGVAGVWFMITKF